MLIPYPLFFLFLPFFHSLSHDFPSNYSSLSSLSYFHSISLSAPSSSSSSLPPTPFLLIFLFLLLFLPLSFFSFFSSRPPLLFSYSFSSSCSSILLIHNFPHPPLPPSLSQPPPQVQVHGSTLSVNSWHNVTLTDISAGSLLLHIAVNGADAPFGGGYPSLNFSLLDGPLFVGGHPNLQDVMVR